MPLWVGYNLFQNRGLMVYDVPNLACDSHIEDINFVSIEKQWLGKPKPKPAVWYIFSPQRSSTTQSFDPRVTSKILALWFPRFILIHWFVQIKVNQTNTLASSTLGQTQVLGSITLIAIKDSISYYLLKQNFPKLPTLYLIFH